MYLKALISNFSMPVRMLVKILIITCAFGAVSCSSESTIIINPDFSGQADIRIQVSDILFRYFQDITGNYQLSSVFNSAEILFELEKRRGITVLQLNQPRSNTLELSLAFDNVNTLLAGELPESVSEDIFIIKTLPNGKTKLTLNLNEHTIPALMDFAPVSNNVLSDYLLPASGRSADPLAYKEDLVWALEEYADAERIEKYIDDSAISFTFALPGPAHDVQGESAIVQSSSYNLGQDITFTLPIINLFTMTIQKNLYVIY